MFLILPPAPELATLVQAYWLVNDPQGDHAGHLIRTSPIPLAILSVNMGRPNAAEDGALVPGISLLGLQSQARAWRSWSDTCFVMVMLSIPGLVRLFPHGGPDSADMLLDLAAITGDACAHSLKSSVGADQDPRTIAAVLDRWLMARLSSRPPVSETAQIIAAHDVLRRGGKVEAAADIAQVDRRQLHRLFHRHLGMGPKMLADLERLQSSLRSVQTGRSDPLLGFSDQAHQIRSWRRRLGITPGAYARAARSPMAEQFGEDRDVRGLSYYL